MPVYASVVNKSTEQFNLFGTKAQPKFKKIILQPCSQGLFS